MAYTRTNWQNNTSPYLNAANLNNIEKGIDDAHSLLEDTPTGDTSTVQDKYRWTYDAASGGWIAAPVKWNEVEDKPTSYPPSAHSHYNYQALLEINLDLLMRGLLYTKAQPFSQSFTFSGDGSRTAFKIPRSAVNQQGWVRGGVTATVDGSAAGGSWNIHTQTYTLSAAPANGASVVISATDVVPYQGMTASPFAANVLRTNSSLLISTSGTGASTTSPNGWFPLSPKLPAADPAYDDALLHDAPAVSGFGANNKAASLWLPRSMVRQADSGRVIVGAGIDVETTGSPRRGVAGFRVYRLGEQGFTAEPLEEAQPLATSIPHLIMFGWLVRVSNPQSNDFGTGEILLGVSVAGLTSTTNLISFFAGHPNSATDFFRLNGGPIVEAS